ncbi:MAG: hypothetical protein Q8918_03115 [Bacteroidota bacterium]|nr:hypothetical protein [Bacteroidota bacterium]MDP4249082.1 hypothetical protein [Bacteroidota bacterium]
MKKLLAHIILSWVLASASAQVENPELKARFVPGNFADFEVDNLGNIYLLNAGNQLKKLSAAGDSLAIFNDVRHYGKISYIDVTNPLKILLYYQEFGTIVMLDRLLNNVNTIDLRKFNLFQVRSIGLSYDNNVWLYDELEGKLKKIGDDGSLIIETTDIRQLTDSVPDPELLIDQGGLVYLYDSLQGVFIFDHYGGFKKFVPLKNWLHFSVIDNDILGWEDRYFLKYVMKTGEQQRREIPACYLPALKIVVRPESIYVLKTDGIHVYKN